MVKINLGIMGKEKDFHFSIKVFHFSHEDQPEAPGQLV